MFEVGKKYKNKNVVASRIVTCIAVGTKKAVLEFMDGEFVTPAIMTGQIFGWEEYKEPLKGKIFVNVYPNSTGVVHPDRERADMSRHQRLACVEVNWVEGQGL